MADVKGRINCFLDAELRSSVDSWFATVRAGCRGQSHPPSCDTAAASSQEEFSSAQVMVQGSSRAAKRLGLGKEHGPGTGSTVGH